MEPQVKKMKMLCLSGCGSFVDESNGMYCVPCYLESLLVRPEPQRSDNSLEDSEELPPYIRSYKKPKVPEKKNRCTKCNKKLGPIGIPCRCGGMFCPAHRYTDEHQCPVDYKALGRQEIAAANPLVVRDKIQKL